MKIRIDEDLCTGHGRCYTLMPSHFDDDERGYGLVVNADVANDEAEAAESVVRSCPERAISIVED